MDLTFELVITDHRGKAVERARFAHINTAQAFAAGMIADQPGHRAQISRVETGEPVRSMTCEAGGDVHLTGPQSASTA